MPNITDKMVSKVWEYKEKNCDQKGIINKSNISRSVANGIKTIKQRVKEKEIVVFAADKTGEFCVDTAANYLDVLKEHTEKDR